MKKRLLTISSFSIFPALASLTLLSSCASDLGEPDNQEADGTGGDSAGTGGGAVGSGGGLGTGGGFGTGGDAVATGGSPGVVYSAGFQTLMDVLSGYKIGRPDYSCAAADCHSGGSETTEVPLRLIQDNDLYDEITTHVSVKCGNIKVVEPGDPANSALMKVLTVGCDDNLVADEKAIPRMPYDCMETEFENSCVADEYIATLEQWIADGAPQF